MRAKDVYWNGEMFSEDLVHEQIKKIFLCPAFSVSDILRRFLSYIINETFAGRSNTIKEYTIAVNVLNKPVGFKPQHDAIVRIHAGRLRRALKDYYKELGIRDDIEITVPKGSYIPVFGRMHPIESKPAVTLIVMPFTCLETNISRQAFADSLGRQLCGEFGRFSDFSVISYYTSLQLTSKNKEIHSLASIFGAQYVITGNVQFETGNLRVDIQLTDTQSGIQIWTELYHSSYRPSNFFKVADHIVTRVISSLGDFNGLIVQQISKGLTTNKSGRSCSALLSSYHNFYSSFNEQGFKKAYADMENAVEKDHANDMVWAFLGELSLVAFLFQQTTRENPILKAFRCAQMALKLNPLSQHGYITLGMAHIFLDNKEASLEALEKARKLNPNASGSMGIIGCLMICAGEYSRGIELIHKSIEFNKSFPSFFHISISLYHFKKREYSQAFLEAEKMDMPDFILGILLRISTLTHMNRNREANSLVRNLKKSLPDINWISKDYFRRFLLDPDLVEQLYKGFKSVNIPLLTVA